ncbi:MAG TPA: Ig-like domain-containing protein [Anaerolineales bacterium]
MDKMIVRALIITMVLSVLALAPQAVRAQAALQPTQIVIAAPARSNVGGRVTVQAVLADSQGHPISKAVIYFTTQAKFLSETSDVVLAQGVTNGKGQAVAEFANDFSGTLTLQAEFRGDTQYAPSNAQTQIGTAGNQQVYAEHVGVDLPGFNVPPVGAPKAAVGAQPGILGVIQGLWPAMNGWPVAAVLLLVWSMYFFAVTFVFRVAALGGADPDPTSADPGRSL